MNAAPNENSPLNSRKVGSHSEIIKRFKAVAICVVVLAALSTLLQKTFATNLPPLLPTNAVSAQTTSPAPALMITNVVVLPPTPSSIGPKDFFPFATTLLGTFLGAYLAYRTVLKKEQREEAGRIERERKEKEKKDYTALVTAHMAMFNQWNIIESTRRTFEPFAKDPVRVLKMPLTVYEVQPLRIPFDNLGYVVQKDADFLQALHLSEIGCLNCLDLIRTFSKMRLTTYKPPKKDEVNAGGTIKPDSETAYAIKMMDTTAAEIFASLERVSKDLFDRTKQVAEFTNANFSNYARLNPIAAFKPKS